MGTLYIVATPIGNLEDITLRALKVLRSSDVILCEDTRRTGLLLSELNKRYGYIEQTVVTEHPVLKPYYDEIESRVTPEIIQELTDGKTIALVSDAGTPLISDPGFVLVRECLKRQIPVMSVPGPSALITALSVSGLPTDRIYFLGYPPEKEQARIRVFTEIKTISSSVEHNPTYILYCAPHKLTGTLQSIQQTLGNIQVVLSRELTKIHEETWRGSVMEACEHFTKPQGEFVILFRLP
jgi:16S rRNA (cytidine1402-2'-O)-methyltransferase